MTQISGRPPGSKNKPKPAPVVTPDPATLGPPIMPDPQDAGWLQKMIVEHRRNLLDPAYDYAQAQMIRHYQDVAGAMQTRLDSLLAEIEQRRADGKDVSPAWLNNADRYKALIEQAQVAQTGFAKKATSLLYGTELDMLKAAQKVAKAATRAQLARTAKDPAAVARVMAGWADLPEDELIALVGAIDRQNPLGDLLYKASSNGLTDIRKRLLYGMAAGQNTAVIGRQLNAAMGGTLARSLTIARTEIHRAYREGSLQSYSRNGDIVAGWQWLSARNANTCAVCWGMDGAFYHVTARMYPHVNCRCTMVPVTKSWAELGYKGIAERPALEPGASVFAKLPATTQARILGGPKHAAYTAGKITLADLVGVNRSQEWGANRFERGLPAALKAAEERAKAEAAAKGQAARSAALVKLHARVLALKEVKALDAAQSALDAAKAKYERFYQASKAGPAKAQELLSAAERAELARAKMSIYRYLDEPLADARFVAENALADARQAATAAAHKLLAADTPVDVTIDVSALSGEQNLLYGWQIRGQVGVYRSLVSNPALNGRTVAFTMQETLFGTAVDVQRSFYSTGTNRVSMSQEAIGRGGVVAHELGHWLEDVDRDALAESLAFVARRTAGEEWRPLSEITGNPAYEAWERAKPDQFLSPYIGKDYGESATEVTSMGIENIVKDPVGFARRDKDHFLHTLRQIRGIH